MKEIKKYIEENNLDCELNEPQGYLRFGRWEEITDSILLGLVHKAGGKMDIDFNPDRGVLVSYNF